MSTELEAKLSVNSKEEVEITEYKITLLDLLGTIFGLLFYVADIFSDIILATWFFQKDYYLYGAFTIISLDLATVIDTLVSFFRKEYTNRGSRFWLQYIAFSLVNVWGITIIFSLIICQYRAYKSQQVRIDMYKKIEQKHLRVARLKLCEVIFETLPQICLYEYMLLFGHIEELRSLKLPFVSDCDELQTTVDLFDVPGLLLLIKYCYFFMAVYVNLNKISRVKMSTMAMSTLFGYLAFNGAIRVFSLRLIFLFPYHSAVIILLHVSVGGIYRYRNISNKNQSIYKRWLKSLISGMVWFWLPCFSIKHKRIFLALCIIHFIGNSVVFVTCIGYLTYPDIFLFGVLQPMSLVSWTIYYFCYFEETQKAWNDETVSDDESENLTS